MNTIPSTRLTQAQWLMLYSRLAKDYPHSVLILRYKCKEVLGFTPRIYTEWFDSEPNSCILLDWYNESKKTFFILKYSEYFGKDQH